MSTPVRIGNVPKLPLVSVTHAYSYGVVRAQTLHVTSPIAAIAGYTPALVPWAVVKTVPPLPGVSGGGGGGTIGYAF